MLMRRTTRQTAALLTTLLVASAASAQFNSQSAAKRYDKATKGANIDDFVKRLHSDDPVVRLEAVKSMGGTRDPKAIEHLIAAMGDTDLRVQVKAVEVLGEIRALEATPVLIQHLFLVGTAPQMKQRLLASLGKIGDVRAARPIMEFLHRDLDPETRGTAIFALGDIGAAESVDMLQDLSTNSPDPTIRRIANDSLNRVQHHQAQAAKETKAPAENFLVDPKAPPKEQQQR